MEQSVPERVTLCGINSSDALMQARKYIAMLKSNQGEELITLQKPNWPEEHQETLSSMHGPIQEVMIFPDRFCAVFDDKGDQLSQYQRFWDDVGSKLMH